VLNNFSPHLSTKTDRRVGQWAAANNVELAYVPFYGSWLNRIEAQFTALRYFALNGTDHDSYREQASMIRRYIAWRNRRVTDPNLRKVIRRAATIKRRRLPDPSLVVHRLAASSDAVREPVEPTSRPSAAFLYFLAAVLLRRGNAGSNTVDDHITALRQALAQLPDHGRRPGKNVLIRWMWPGHPRLIDRLTRWLLAYSIGFSLPGDLTCDHPDDTGPSVTPRMQAHRPWRSSARRPAHADELCKPGLGSRQRSNPHHRGDMVRYQK
jgi:hypothetical protein